jgi:myo-inositol 2-dehydrogenase/D-chiro-inositol 1-dehydrogenase/scyllo-inositol 2-dehydrogenase (NAD+)
MAEALRFGLIGCGNHGRLQLSALARVPGTTLVACSDPNEAAMRAVAVGGVAGFSDYRTMLERSDLDAVIVVTAHHALAAAVTAVAESGRHVFCEKPLATTAAAGRPAVAAAGRAGVNLMVGYCLRYDALRRRMKELLDACAVGEVAFVVAGKGGSPHQSGWQLDPALGGGQLMWVGSHLVDQVNWMLGRRAERVYAEMERRPDVGTDNTTVFTIRYGGGVLAHLDCSQATHATYDFVEVVGSRGRVRADWRPRPSLSVHSDAIAGFEEPTTVEPVSSDNLAMYAAELTEFVDSVRQRRPPAIGGEDALRVLEVLDAAVASADRGAPVSLSGAPVAAGA